MEDKLNIIPLGGLEEVGRNMTIFEYGNKIIIVDMGIQFPDADMPGVDFIIPNISYLKGKEKNILGLLLTHGHYDHIGAIPYLIHKIGSPPIFATSLTKGIVVKRQEDFKNGIKLNIKEIKRSDRFKLGPFEIESFPQNHNIPDGVGLVIKTPVGNILHTGDFKFDHTPVGDEPVNLKKIEKIASQNILLLMSDSTNAEMPGHSISEKTIQQNLEKIFKESNGRIIAATFASLLSRIQELIFLAQKYNRKVLIDGWSMKNNVEIALKLGKLKVKNNTLISSRQIKKISPKNLLIICTGSQGEGDASLMKLAHKDHKYLSIQEGDSIILSSSIVPGNEKSVQELKDLLSKQGAKIYHSQMMDIHASGHAQHDELKLMMEITKPKFFMPIHGSFYMRVLHKEIAQEVGIPKENIIISENGQVIEISKDRTLNIAKKKIASNYVMVDGLGIGDVGEVVLRDRQMMAKDGMFVIIVLIDSETGRVKQSPDIISRGFVYLRESKKLLFNARQLVINLVEHITQKQTPVNLNYVKNEIKEKLGEFLFKKTSRRPMVLPVVLEV